MSVTDIRDSNDAGSATLRWEIRRHQGPLADEVFILCRPDTAEKDILGQSASLCHALSEALRQAGGSAENVLQETMFFRNIKRDLESALKIQSQMMNPAPGNISYDPAATRVQQAPVDARQLIELSAYAVIPKSEQAEIKPSTTLFSQQTGKVLLLAGCKHVFLSNIYGQTDSSEVEAYDMFQAAEMLLHEEQMSFHDVVRTWIHHSRIDRDYSGLNRGRTRFFREQGLALPPASTGIGGMPCFKARNMCLSLYAIEDASRIMQPMSTPTLNEAWAYGSDFSRGVKVTGKNGITLFVSGTASVDEKGCTAHTGDFEAQVARTILNISALLEKQQSSFRDVVFAITYIKNAEDAPRLNRILAREGISGFPNALVQASVCRPDLLCEMEAIAILPL
jgi:enamine deaminase RidA (YjgF/YER057c/UK114 family)